MEIERIKSEVEAPTSDIYVEFWLRVIYSGVECKDYAYFEGETFAHHFNLIPDRYFEHFLGLKSEEITLSDVREAIMRGMDNA